MTPNERTRALVLDKLYEEVKEKLILIVTDYAELEFRTRGETAEGDEMAEIITEAKASVLALISEEVNQTEIAIGAWPEDIDRK